MLCLEGRVVPGGSERHPLRRAAGPASERKDDLTEAAHLPDRTAGTVGYIFQVQATTMLYCGVTIDPFFANLATYFLPSFLPSKPIL